ncbi:MAG: bifunctional metallophosphatase/5'-nucleotidase [Chitinivibrionales bacterium]|nr:bifunctional metallophosphatase/5'-nucleotidase [Chitinivibrionales bacterium]MBD3357291.1 bifunctional metallophosphatase/5'-nucleotidase [Chitinivibrionales bacterium]
MKRSVAFVVGAALVCAGSVSAKLQWRDKAWKRIERTVGVQLLAINDFHGQLDGKHVAERPAGGAPVLAAYLKAAEEDSENPSYFIHCGDLVGASPPASALLQDEPSIMFFNMLGNQYTKRLGRFHPRGNLIGVPGNHEFDEGIDELMRLLRGGNHEDGPFLEDPWNGANFPQVCANIVDKESNKPVFRPFVIRREKGVPFAFVGACLEETPTIVTASGVAGLSFEDEAESINKYVRLLKKWGIEAIIVVIHQGGTMRSYTGPTNPDAYGLEGDIVPILDELDEEVDVVLTGHRHGFTNVLYPKSEGNAILVAQAWSKSTAYADVDIEISRRTRDVVYKSAEIITTWGDEGPGLTPDPEVIELVEAAEEAVAPLTERPVAEAAAAILRERNEAGESALGNLIADAQRAKMGTDFAFMNPGGIRADIDSGIITWGELYTVQPFNNYLISMDLTGQQIYDLLNMQWPPYQPYNRILQISGCEYTWDNTRDDMDKVVEIRKDGQPIDRDASYSVTVNSFIAEGGDNFTVLTEGANKVTGPIDLDALIEYLQSFSLPVRGSIEGRIERWD